MQHRASSFHHCSRIWLHFLGHELINGFHGRTTNTRKPQADMFATSLLSPAFVLWGLDIHCADDIAKVCNISSATAKRRAERIVVLYKQQRFLINPLEKKVYEQFQGYIKREKLIILD